MQVGKQQADKKFFDGRGRANGRRGRGGRTRDVGKMRYTVLVVCEFGSTGRG